ncbi:hypothetical protein ABGB17_08610 [Sphaerisporangium sp. B11E5]|uniref:hypothetical protein n=1 Tax=Sphaerisporangium sp. B11E5 TaxID=3153563 RepID=UPI00325C5447
MAVTPPGHSENHSVAPAGAHRRRLRPGRPAVPCRQAALGRLLAAKAAASGGRPMPGHPRDGGSYLAGLALLREVRLA